MNERQVHASDPALARRTLLIIAAIAFPLMWGTTVFLVSTNPEAATFMYWFIGAISVLLLGGFVVGWRRQGRPLTLEIGADCFVLRSDTERTYNWAEIEAAWFVPNAGALQFRVLPSKKRDGISLRGYSHGVQEKIIGDFRARLGTRFVSIYRQPIG